MAALTQVPEQPTRLACTVGILTFNSAAVLERALDATEAFAERIVCDGGSDDATVSLALSRGCRVLKQKPEFRNADGRLVDFAGAMNQIVEAATQPWFLKLDSDEVPSGPLVTEIERVVSGAGDVEIFNIPLRYVVKSREIANASTYPIAQPRLFRIRDDVRYSRSVHEFLDLGDRPVGVCDNPILLPQWPVRVLIPRWWRYLLIEADQLRGTTFRDRFRTVAKSNARAVKYFSWRYSQVLRSSLRPRHPLRYEATRIANHAVAIPVMLLMPMVHRRRQPSTLEVLEIPTREGSEPDDFHDSEHQLANTSASHEPAR